MVEQDLGTMETLPADRDSDQSSNVPREQLLAPSLLLQLRVQTTVVLLTFYFTCTIALLFIVLLILIDLVVLLAATRFGLAGYMKAPLEALTQLALQVAQSLNLRRGRDYGLSLRAEQAPGLFQAVQETADQMHVSPPQRIVLMMNDCAWIRLRGYRQGQGHTTLGIGYDLLAILTEEEFRAVLAHEMAHARLIQRGYKGWLANGMTRISQLADSLSRLTQQGEGKKRFFTAEVLGKVAWTLGKIESRLVASYYRQDEFAADRAAAACCRPGIYAQALITAHLSDLTERAPSWRERLVQFQREGTISDWLHAALTPRDHAERQELMTRAMTQADHDAFSSHPPLSDRLAALPGMNNGEALIGAPELLGNTRPAIALLANPDRVAGDLIAELERFAILDEKAHSDDLRHQIRKQHPRTKNTAGELLGFCVLVLGVMAVIMTIVALGSEGWKQTSIWLLLTTSLGVLGLGIGLMFVFRLREKQLLPIPAFAEWQNALSARDVSQAHLARQSQRRPDLKRELKADLPPQIKTRSQRAQYWGQQAYTALQRCEYLRADIAAELCLEARPKSLEGRIARGITAAYFGDAHTINSTLGMALHEYGAGPSVSWALGWSLLMLENWVLAEAYLQQARAHRPEAAVLRSLLGLCQWHCGKLREAAQNVREALTLEPHESAHRQLLVNILLAAGQVQDAERELALLKESLPEDRQVLTSQVHAALLLGQQEKAEVCAAALEAAYPGPTTLLRLASLYQDAGEDDKAQANWDKVNALGFYPEAFVGLASLAYARKEFDKTRSLLLSAIDMTQQIPEDAQAPLAFLDTALQGLIALSGPAKDCQEWIAAISLPSAEASALLPSQRMVLQIFASTQEEAGYYAAELCQAIQPGLDMAKNVIEWTPGTARSSKTKPTEPIVPGIHGYRFE